MPEVAKTMIAYLLSGIGGWSQYKQSSFLYDTIDKKIVSDQLSFYEDPHRLGKLYSCAFDQDAIATEKGYIIKEGYLQKYLLSHYSANRLGMQPTGHASGIHGSQLMHKNTCKEFSSLVEQMGTGLIVTELFSQGVNLLTGDFSKGCFGFWVENGEVLFPVNEITVSGNLTDFFLGVESACEEDIDFRGNLHTGSILINKIIVGGK